MAIFNWIRGPRQLSEHNPCGHWHKRQHNYGASVARSVEPNCWNIATNIHGNDIVLAIYGLHYPHQIYLFQYNMSTRIWRGPYNGGKEFYASQWQAAAVIDNVDLCWFGYGGDSSGSVLDFTATNYRARYFSINYSTENTIQHNFTDSRPMNCEGKLAIERGTGKAMALVETNTVLRLYVSTTMGQNWVIGEEFSYSGGYLNSRIVNVPIDSFFIAILYGDLNVVHIYHSNDGLTWALRSTQNIPGAATRFNFLFDGGVLCLQIDDRFFYSADGGVNFTLRTVDDPTNFISVDGVNKDLLLFYLDGNQVNTDFTITPLTYTNLGEIPTVKFEDTNFTTVKNYGRNVVYSKDNMFFEKRIVLPVSLNLGQSWDIVQTPIDYFANNADRLVGADNPKWKFAQSREFMLVDSDYK